MITTSLLKFSITSYHLLILIVSRTTNGLVQQYIKDHHHYYIHTHYIFNLLFTKIFSSSTIIITETVIPTITEPVEINGRFIGLRLETDSFFSIYYEKSITNSLITNNKSLKRTNLAILRGFS